MDVFNYECVGQLSLFDDTEKPSGFSENALNPPEEPICKNVNECEAYPIGCGGTIEPCRFGGPYKWNKEN